MLERARASATWADLGSGEWAVDVGGGYGRHAATWVPLGLRPVVLDPAPEMHERRDRDAGVGAVRATWERLPFRDETMGMVYAHLSIHYSGPERAVAEAVRVVRPGGAVSVWTLGPRHHSTSFLSRWFPSVPGIDAQRFPDPGVLVDLLRQAGVASVERDEVDAPVERSVGEFVAAVAARFVSTLQLVPEHELEEGLGRFREQHPDPAEMIRYSLRYDWVKARV